MQRVPVSVLIRIFVFCRIILMRDIVVLVLFFLGVGAFLSIAVLILTVSARR